MVSVIIKIRPIDPVTVDYLEKKIKQLERRFNKQLKYATRDSLRRRGVPVTSVVDALADLLADDIPEHKLFLEGQLNVLYQASDLIELFGSLNFNMNYLSYHLVEYLILKFDLKIKSEMVAYKNDLHQFRKKTPVKLFSKTQKRNIHPPSKFERVIAKFEWPEDHDDITLEDAEKFRQDYAQIYNLHECAMILSETSPDFCISWLMPAEVVKKLKLINAPTKNIFRKHFITEFNIAGECVHCRVSVKHET